jgi:hypothetical protein
MTAEGWVLSPLISFPVKDVNGVGKNSIWQNGIWKSILGAWRSTAGYYD